MKHLLLGAIIVGNAVLVEANELPQLEAFPGNIGVSCAEKEQVFKFMSEHKFNDTITSENVVTKEVQNAKMYKFTNDKGNFQYWLEDVNNGFMCLVATFADDSL